MDGEGGYFNYFAFASNLVSKRVLLNSPLAKKIGPAKLKDFKLDFGGQGSKWKGATATIDPKEGKSVYGVLWQISNEDKEKCYHHEGVHLGIYKPIDIEVESCASGEKFQAKAFQIIKKGDGDPRPSLSYLRVILKGARESELPEEYNMEELEKIPHNGYDEELDVDVPLY